MSLTDSMCVPVVTGCTVPAPGPASGQVIQVLRALVLRHEVERVAVGAQWMFDGARSQSPETRRGFEPSMFITYILLSTQVSFVQS
jgi:hypothetical protein